MARKAAPRRDTQKALTNRHRGGAALGKLTVVVGSPRAAGLRRAIGVILVAGLCVSAVTFYRDTELPRSAPSVASTETAMRHGDYQNAFEPAERRNTTGVG
jgi:hypothetical protein